ncbi:VOC family protein [Tabrizicola sp. J26]|uniref:VOC family protein n=1 Tax=Alitabrizicola rongguiensis TaxID=2909234 RepID=UPI001F3AB2EE|nr:VOC family protein [Tabrizicola rongguiensis]MCF1709729.1 VOC family protein [Tabrizicola rongguiensis]
MSTSSAPVEIGRVALTVNDLGRVADFYRALLGFETLSADGEVVVLGAGGKPLLELRGDRAARVRSRREAGLFHTAFLLPSREDLGAWLRHMADKRLPVSGASDHLVSEAIYLDDPEGNGIEVYSDRPRESWTTENGQIKMATEHLDIDSLFAAARAPWTGAPDGTVVGHVHLQVGNVPEAEAFYHDTLGFDIKAHYPGASFMSSGGYHHHLGANVWQSRGAGQRSYPSTGLADLELLADAPSYDALVGQTGTPTPTDPWGTQLTITRKAA